MKPLGFKGVVAKDLQGVFLNLEEFADLHTVKYGGRVVEDIPVSIQETEQSERTQMKADHAQGFFQEQAVLFCARSDLPGKLPGPGDWLEINSGKNPQFFHKYQVGAASEEMGMARIELGRFGQ